MATYTATTTPQQVATAGVSQRFTNLGQEPVVLTVGGVTVAVLSRGEVAGSAVFSPRGAVMASTRMGSSAIEVSPEPEDSGLRGSRGSIAYDDLAPDVLSGLSATYAPITPWGLPNSGRTFYTMGDSISANNFIGLNNYGSAGNNYGLWAHLLSNSAFRHVGAAATAGYTTAQIRATCLPTVLAAKPTSCVVLGGTNGQASFPTKEIADLTAIYTALMQAGIIPIACTIPPTNSDPNNSNKMKLNGWIRRYARLNGIPLADFYAVTVDPANGQWLSGYTGDGTHPTTKGSKAMGTELAAVFTELARRNLPELPDTQTNTSAAFQNNLLQSNTGTSPNRPTGWNAIAGGTSFTAAFTTDATKYAGNLYTFTRGASDVFLGGTSFQAASGDRLLVGMRLAATVEGVGGAWGLRLRKNDDNTASLLEFTNPTADLPLSAYVTEITMSAAGAGIDHYLEVRAMTASGAAMSFAQPWVINLTALGMA